VKQQRKARIDFDHLRRTVPITAVLEKYGVLGELRRSGAQLKGRCPIHDGNNTSRSFVVNPVTNVWKCFSPSCDKGGAMLELVAEIEKVETYEAALLVAKWFGIKNDKSCNRTKRRSVK